MASIASAALVLTTEASKLYAGLDAAASKVKAFASKAGSTLKGGLSGIGSFLKTGISEGMGALHDVTDRIKELAKTGKMAKGLGVDSEMFMGLGTVAKKAGIETEEFAKMLAHLNENAYKAANGGKELHDKLNLLGIDADKFNKLSADQKFLRLADALSRSKDAGLNAHVTQELLGKSGFRMAGTLQNSSAKLREMVAEFKRLGIAISQADMDKVMAASAAVGKLDKAYEGFKNKVAVALAPHIEEWATKAQVVFQGMVDVLDAVVSRIDAAAKALDKMAKKQEGGNWFGKGGAIADLSEAKKSFQEVGWMESISAAAGPFFESAWLDFQKATIKTLNPSNWTAELEKEYRKKSDAIFMGAGQVHDELKKMKQVEDKLKKEAPKVNPFKGPDLPTLSGDTKLPGLNIEGSVEAYKTQAQFELGGVIEKNNEQIKLLQVANGTTAEMKKLLLDILNAFRGMQVLGVA